MKYNEAVGIVCKEEYRYGKEVAGHLRTIQSD